MYGKRGKGYIQVHHEKPISQNSDEGIDEYIAKALDSVKLVCANCHCIIHRYSNEILSVGELKEMISNNKISQF